MKKKLLDTVLQLEHQVWTALAEGDVTADERLLADDFLGVYPSGFAKKTEHSGQLDSGPSIAHYEILDPQIQELSEQVVLLAYLANYVRINSGVEDKLKSMYVTSIWRQTNGVWQNIFSQDTPAEK
ncbi:MAG: DUF4440 domain-containing protein [Anaerolineae bacterium]